MTSGLSRKETWNIPEKLNLPLQRTQTSIQRETTIKSALAQINDAKQQIMHALMIKDSPKSQPQNFMTLTQEITSFVNSEGFYLENSQGGPDSLGVSMCDDLQANPPNNLGAPLRSTIVEETIRESVSHRSAIPSEREGLVIKAIDGEIVVKK